MNEEVALSRYTTLGTGGAARWFDSPESVEELGARLAWAQSEGLPVAVVGLGSNLLVADDGFPGLVVKLAGELARAEAAELAAHRRRRGLARRLPPSRPCG